MIKRVVGAIGVVLVTLVACSAIIAVLVPDAAPRSGAWAGTLEGVTQRLRGDFGTCFVYPGAVPVRTMFARGVAVDLELLAGGLVAGTLLGVLGGRLCAAHPRSAPARALEAVATFAICTPVYLIGFGLLLLFEPTFGVAAHVHGWLEPGRYESLRASPWHWFQAMLVPWVLVGLPIAGIALRLTSAATLDTLDAPFVRTARALGLPRGRVIAHAARPTYVMTAAALSTQVRALVLNVMFVEYVFFLPGFLWLTKRSIGSDPPLWTRPDVNTLAAIAVWSAVLVVVLGLLADLAAVALDPRIEIRE